MIKNKMKWSLLALLAMTCIMSCSINGKKSNSGARETSIQNSSIKKPITNNRYKKSNAGWLAGSWGISQRVDGGYRLDKSAKSSNWQAGAKQIVKNLPAAGHVITSFTHPAHAYLYTLRKNNRVDVAAIHPKMVPTLENEKIIFDVINIYRKAGKKVILYLNAAGPSMIGDDGADNDIKRAWKKYYTTQWNGDEGAAWRNLVLGYAERFNGLIDGYWLDNARKLPGDLSKFIAMLRSVDPTLSIAVNRSKEYFTDDKGNHLYVDSDGVNDNNKRDYKIVKHVPLDEFSDFTAGHVTPLGRGAPPNSWGYEEYTIPDMAKTPWTSYNRHKKALKHAWFPIRERWSVAKTKIVFEVEQAYRFVRTITDNGAAMTWSTTQKKGFMKPDEMKIMVEINSRMTQNPKAPFKAYKRPKGATLVKTQS